MWYLGDVMARVSVLGCFILVLVNGSKDVQLTNGVRLVQVEPENTENEISEFRNFLTSHQLQVQLEEILPVQGEVQRGLKGALDYLNRLEIDEGANGRRGGGGGGMGGKKGGGAILAMATMMGGTMAALGFGAVGMLAMKALTVSAMALMLSAVIGLKKLLSKGDDGGHSVSYIPVHGGGGGHHRRRRHAPFLAYQAYAPS